MIYGCGECVFFEDCTCTLWKRENNVFKCDSYVRYKEFYNMDSEGKKAVYDRWHNAGGECEWMYETAE